MAFVITSIHNTPIQKSQKKPVTLTSMNGKIYHNYATQCSTDGDTNNSINGERNYTERHHTTIPTYNDLPKLLKVLAKF